MKLALRPMFFGLAMASGFTLACDKIPVTMHTETTIRHMDGTVDHKSSDWHGTLDQLPAQLSKAGKELGEVTAKMAKELTDVPPPGHVELKDLSPSFEKYQGKRGSDFLITAQDEHQKPITFKYVRIGQASYDDFFKTAQEIYALIYQTTQVIGQMRQIATKVLDTKVEANANLKANVDKALSGTTDGTLIGDIKEMTDMGSTLGVLVPEIANKLAKLVQTGEALIAGAASSITNPKVLTHLGLIKEGLTDSVKVIKESGSLMADFGKTLSPFKA